MDNVQGVFLYPACSKTGWVYEFEILQADRPETASMHLEARISIFDFVLFLLHKNEFRVLNEI